MKIGTYRSAALLYLLFFLALSWPYWLKGEVVAPHRQQAELAQRGGGGNAHLENHRFSDATNAYVPEITMHLAGPRSTWLALWTPQNELGRLLTPTEHWAADVRQVRWQFRPWANYSWMGHLAWSLLCCALVLQAWRARRSHLAVGLRKT